MKARSSEPASAARLDLDVHVDERYRRGRDAGNPASLTERARADAGELFVHLTGQARDLAIVEPIRNRALLGLLQPLDRFRLLVEITGVLNLGLDRLELVADFRWHEFRARLIVGKLRNDHSIVFSHGQVPGVNLSAGCIGGLSWPRPAAPGFP